jgi:general secretion pathway protein C
MKFATAKSAKNASNRTPNSWTLRLFTLLVWLLVGLCAAYWAFKFVTSKSIEATAAVAAPTVVVDSKAVGKLLGATDNVAAKAVNTPASTKFVLFGLANSAAGQGYALIALDGKPAKPYRVGTLVADNLLLKSISKTGVILAASLKAPDGVTLELPARKPANTVPISNIPNPAVANPSAPPMVNAAVISTPQAPFIPPAAPAGIMPSVSAASGAGLNERTAATAAAISRFAPQASEGMSPGRPPVSSSAASER